MNLSDKAIIEFQKLYEKRFNKKISFEEAKVKASKFLRLFKAVFDSKGDP